MKFLSPRDFFTTMMILGFTILSLTGAYQVAYRIAFESENSQYAWQEESTNYAKAVLEASLDQQVERGEEIGTSYNVHVQEILGQ